MDEEDIIEEIYSVPYWRQRIPINGFETPGRSTPDKFNKFDIESELSGNSVLDIGSWDGLHAFLAESHGATDVLSTDVWSAHNSDNPDWWMKLRPDSADAGIRTARELRESNIDIKDISVYDLSTSNVGERDIVLFPSVLYHLKYPYKAIEQLYEITGQMAVIETPIVLESESKLEFNPSNQTPWFFPTQTGLIDMLSTAGFTEVEVIEKHGKAYPTDIVYIKPNTQLKRFAEGKISSTGEQLGKYQQALMLQEGDSVSSRFSEHTYVELNLGQGPSQYWVSNDSIEKPLEHMLKSPRNGMEYATRYIVQDIIKEGRLGRIPQRFFGLRPRIIIKAYV